MSDYTKLVVWQKAHALAIEVDKVASQMRGARRATLRAQVTRAAMSIPANIVEGSTQQSRRQFVRYLRIALNSSSELEYHVLFGRDSGALSPQHASFIRDGAVEVRKMLHGLINRLEKLAADEQS